MIPIKTDTHLELNYPSLISNNSSDTESSLSSGSEDMEIDAEMLEMEVKEEYMKSQLNRFQKIAKKIELDKWLDTSIVSSDPPYTTFRTIKRGAHLKEGPLYQLPDSTLINS